MTVINGDKDIARHIANVVEYKKYYFFTIDVKDFIEICIAFDKIYIIAVTVLYR